VNQEQFERTLQELQAGTDDIRPSDVVVFSEPLRSTLNLAVRWERISLTEFAKELEIERGQAKQIAEILLTRNLFRPSPLSDDQETYYEIRMSALSRPLGRPRPDIWKKIDD
jgi:hypothetical protein